MTILPGLRDELSAPASRLPPDDARRRWWRSGRRLLVAVPVAAAVLGGLALAATTFTGDDRPFATSQYRYGHCPTHVLSLGPNALRQAKLAAVRQAQLAYPRRALAGTVAETAQVVTARSPRSADAARCGLLGKTVLVELRLPSPVRSASLSQGAVYVSLVKPPGRRSYYLLWGLEH
jgi:hypothetical protein